MAVSFRLAAALSSTLDYFPPPISATPRSSQMTVSSKSSFIPIPNPLLSAPLLLPSSSRRKALLRCEATRNYDHIPKQFREENLKDGLMDNFQNVPQHLYGLNPSQLDMFMQENNPLKRQSEKVTEESISSKRNYLDNGGIWSLSGKPQGSSKYRMSATMYYGGARGYGRPRSAPPDLPSLLLDARIVFLGMPIFPQVTELIVAQLMWLDYDNITKPIYLYINSPGTQNEKKENVASETEAYAIADALLLCKSKIYTVNTGMAFGQAAMLFSLGAKGFRALQPNATTKLYLPKTNKSSGAVTDMWIKAKELGATTDYYIELLAKGIGKTKEEIAKDIRLPKFLPPKDAIEYGIADRIIKPEDAAYDKKDYDGLLAKSKANTMRRRVGRADQEEEASSGFR